MPRRKEDAWYEDAVREIDEHRKDPEKWKEYVAAGAMVGARQLAQGRDDETKKVCESSPS